MRLLVGELGRADEGVRPYVVRGDRGFLGAFLGGYAAVKSELYFRQLSCARTATFRLSRCAGSRDALVPAGTFPCYLRTCAPISLAATDSLLFVALLIAFSF